MQEVLSDVLRLLRLKSCVYFLRDFSAPWAMKMDQSPFAQFHVVVRGRCVADFHDQQIDAAAGDILHLPHGSAHSLADQAGREAVPGMRVLQDQELFSKGPAATQLLCGHYEYRSDIKHPLLEQLPDVIHLKSFEFSTTSGIEGVLPLLLREMNEGAPGSDVIIERLAEILLIQVLRAYLAQAKIPAGFLAAMSDTRLTRAIKLIHDHAAEKLTIDDLATAAGMSRSGFALQFKKVSEISPIAYLVKWRLWQATDLLNTTGMRLARVAEKSGYESEISFSRAFKREFGIAPGQYRRQSAR
ncbi:MAG: AraC family transcriptional regulator [Rhodospirillaceae bacterium]|jgi:AraC family transcriptional regulator, activator of mtrCDE|nr:AraC family transcriptional regulator [Rhodospirillaceae bacterium]